jgi:hypothetical protein
MARLELALQKLKCAGSVVVEEGRDVRRGDSFLSTEGDWQVVVWSEWSGCVCKGQRGLNEESEVAWRSAIIC